MKKALAIISAVLFLCIIIMPLFSLYIRVAAFVLAFPAALSLVITYLIKPPTKTGAILMAALGIAAGVAGCFMTLYVSPGIMAVLVGVLIFTRLYPSEANKYLLAIAILCMVVNCGQSANVIISSIRICREGFFDNISAGNAISNAIGEFVATLCLLLSFISIYPSQKKVEYYKAQED